MQEFPLKTAYHFCCYFLLFFLLVVVSGGVVAVVVIAVFCVFFVILIQLLLCRFCWYCCCCWFHWFCFSFFSSSSSSSSSAAAIAATGQFTNIVSSCFNFSNGFTQTDSYHRLGADSKCKKEKSKWRKTGRVDSTQKVFLAAIYASCGQTLNPLGLQGCYSTGLLCGTMFMSGCYSADSHFSMKLPYIALLCKELWVSVKGIL